MISNKVIGSILGLIVVGIAGFTALQGQPAKPVVKDVTPAKALYTIAQVSGHNTASSCWAVINRGVYDLTSWISKHPGGQEAILSLCGTDGSSAFNDQHGGQTRPVNELDGFKIGSLTP